MKKFLISLFILPAIALGAFTEFYCDATNGSNLNGGSSTATSVYTSTNGNWNGSTSFTPTDGSNPATASPGCTVGDFASVYLDAASVGVFIARVTAVTNATNGAITVSSTSKAGSAPTSGATGRTIKCGGLWKGPNAGVGFPLNLSSLGSATNSSSNRPRINLKNNATYSISTGISVSSSTAAVVQGYSSSAGDGGKAVIDISTNAITGINGTMTAWMWADLEIKGSASSGSNDLFVGSLISLNRIVVHGARGNGISVGGLGGTLSEVEVYGNNTSNTSGAAGIISTGPLNMRNCYVHDNTGSNNVGVLYNGANVPAFIVNTIFDSNVIGYESGASTGSSMVDILNCDFYNQSGDAIKTLAGTAVLNVTNTNFVKNTGARVNINTGSAGSTGFMFNSGNGSGTQANGSDTLGGIVESGAVTYTSNTTPYSAPTTGNFSLIGKQSFNAGRGVFTETDGTNTGTVGWPDIGAANHLDVGSLVLNLSDTTYPVGYLTKTWELAQTFNSAATVTISSGSLPTGLALSQPTGSSVLITGTPTVAGTYDFTTRITVGSAFMDFPSHITINADPDGGAGGLGGD